MRYGSLCSGIGGFDRGFHRAGWEPAWFCEYEPWRRKILARHWPGVPIHPDISTIDPDGLERVDALIGGTPCQDLSVAGRRRGLAGARSGLFEHFMRVRDALGVPHTVWENVPGVFTSNGGMDFACVLEAFVGARPAVPTGGWRGAGVASGPRGGCVWRTLDSRHFGVPQRRRRVFVVGRLGGGVQSEILFELEGGGGNPAPGAAEGEGAAAGARAGAGGAGRAAPAGAGRAGGGGVRAAARRGRGAGGPGDGGVAAPLTRGSAADSNPPGRRQEDDVNLVAGPAAVGSVLGDGELAATLKAHRGKGGGGLGPEETLLPRAAVEEAGALQASRVGYRNDAGSAGAGHYALGQEVAGALGRMGESGGHRLDLDGHGAYVASRDETTSLDTRMGNGPDDNRAQAGHLVVSDEANTLTNRYGAQSGQDIDDGSRLVAGAEPASFNWQSGGDVRHGVREGEASALQASQTQAVFGLSDGEAREGDVAPTLAGGNPAPGGRHPGRSATQFTGVYTKRHNAESADHAETWEESDETRALNTMDGDRTTLAAARQLVRRLTPTECERLQALPDGWTHPSGPSLADAPAWHELGPEPGGAWASYNALPDQRERDRGAVGAVELRETDRSLTLDQSGRDPSAHNGGMMLVRSVHEQGDGRGKVGDVYEKDEVDALAAGGGGKPGQGYPLVRAQPYTVHSAESPTRSRQAFETDTARSIDGAGAYAGPRGGTVVGFKTDGDERSSPSAGEGAPTLRGAEAGTAAVVVQPRDEARSHTRPDSDSDDVVLGEQDAHLDAIAGEVRGASLTTSGSDESWLGVTEAEAAPLNSEGAWASTQGGTVAFSPVVTGSLTSGEGAGTNRSYGGCAARAEDVAHAQTAKAVAGVACPYDPPPDGPRYSSLGDAVTASVAEWIARRLRAVLAGETPGA